MVNGGDGFNHFPGGGANYDGVSASYGLAGASTTDTTNPSAIRFGAVVGTFSAAPLRSDWFLVGRSNSVTVPPGGAHLHLAINDAYYPNNAGNYLGLLTIGSGPPMSLSIVKMANGVLLSWPDSGTNYVLQCATNLLPAPAWLTVTNIPVAGSGRLSVTVNTAGASRFFRLRQTAQ
jgi:hypothetical protein